MPTHFSEKDHEDFKKYWHTQFFTRMNVPEGSHYVIYTDFPSQAMKQAKSWPYVHCTVMDLHSLAASSYQGSFLHVWSCLFRG